MEPGLAPQAGDLRITLTTLYGSDFEGGHFERVGVDAVGRPISVPLHRHEVSLDYTRVELGVQYHFTEHWSATLRVPWEEKAQHASIALVDPATDLERAAMQRNSDLHHRSETYRGLGDPQLIAHRRVGDLRFGAGFTLPTGDTVENPYLAIGKHLHIQFGSGTVDPIFEIAYVRNVLGAYASARLPLYENAHTFRAPPEVSGGVTATRRIGERFALRGDIGGSLQGYGEWDGVRDENTGLATLHAAIGASWRVRSVALSADVRIPVAQRTLQEGDAFEQGPTLIVSVSSLIR